MRKTLILFLLLPFYIFGQNEKNHDSIALYIIDKMSSVMNGLESVSFDLQNSFDDYSFEGKMIKHYSTHKVISSGNDKLRIYTSSSKGKKGYWYDGIHFSFYNFDENNYITLEVPDNTIDMFDEMHENFGFKFPAADFFYPSLTDDMIDSFELIKYMGKVAIDNEECYHILAENSKISVQIWISHKMYLLPKHFVVVYKDKNNMQYHSSFHNWNINPKLPSEIFDFLPPPNAKLISILKKS